MSDATPWDRRATWTLVALVAACAVSLIWLVHPWYEASGSTNDGSIYLLCAQSMLDGDGYSFLNQPFTLRPPGFSVLLLPVLAWRGLDYHALNLLVASFGVAAVACSFAYHRPRLGTWLALAVAASLWLNPGFERFFNRVMSDVPGTALLLGGLLLDRWARRKPSLSRDALVGVFVGASAYVRTVDVLLAPAIVCARVCERWRAGERGGWLSFVRDRCVVPLLVPALVVLPWSIRNSANPPELPVDQTFVHSYSVALLHTDTADPDSPLVSAGTLVARAGENAAAVLTSMGNRMSESEPTVLSWIVGAAIAIGALAAAWRRRDVGDFALLAMLAAFSISLDVRDRYVLPIYALALPSAVDSYRAWLGRFAGERAARAGLTAGLLIVAAIDFAPHREWKELRERHQRMQALSNALSRSLPPDARLATSVGWHWAVYLGRPVFSLAPRVKHDPRKSAVDLVLDRYQLNTVFCDPTRSIDHAVSDLMHERFGEPNYADSLEVWRVRR
jgi:hypothetical protein